MKYSPLRDLARRYAAGNLAAADYLAQRSQLINNYIQGKQSIAYRETRPVLLVTPQRWQRYWPVAAGVVLVLALIVGSTIFYTPDTIVQKTTSTATAPSNNTAATIVREFLNGGDWSDAHLLEFELAWNALTPFERETARRSPWFRRLETETRRRLQAADTLMDLDQSTETKDRIARLQTFAERIGIAME